MSAIAGIDIALWDLKARRLGVPIYSLLGGRVRDKVQVYAWIGGDRPNDVEAAAKERKKQGLRCVKMNATEDVGWVDSPKVLEGCVERVKAVKALGMDVGVDFHGRLHVSIPRNLYQSNQTDGHCFRDYVLASTRSSFSPIQVLSTDNKLESDGEAVGEEFGAACAVVCRGTIVDGASRGDQAVGKYDECTNCVR